VNVLPFFLVQHPKFIVPSGKSSEDEFVESNIALDFDDDLHSPSGAQKVQVLCSRGICACADCFFFAILRRVIEVAT